MTTFYNRHHWDAAADDHDDDDDILNCRIKIELNRLNESSEEINRLENDLDKARSVYQNTLSNRTHELDQISSHIRKSIALSRAYYEKKEISKCVQEETLRAARQFQTANSIYQAAKETILLAEEQLMQENYGQCHTSEISSSTQEALNHAIIRLMEAEKEKRKREEEHHRTASFCSELEVAIKKYERHYTKAIAKSRPYFEKKNEMKEALEMQKKKVDSLQTNLQKAKEIYSDALKNLEKISEEVHKRRKLKEFLYLPREPGVGSERNDYANATEIESEAMLKSYPLSTRINDDKENENNNINNNNNNNSSSSNNNNINNNSKIYNSTDRLYVEASANNTDEEEGSSSSEMSLSFSEDSNTDSARLTSTDEESTDEIPFSRTLVTGKTPTGIPSTTTTATTESPIPPSSTTTIETTSSSLSSEEEIVSRKTKWIKENALGSNSVH